MTKRRKTKTKRERLVVMLDAIRKTQSLLELFEIFILKDMASTEEEFREFVLNQIFGGKITMPNAGKIDAEFEEDPVKHGRKGSHTARKRRGTRERTRVDARTPSKRQSVRGGRVRAHR